jgi:hypothetical protein
LWGEGTQPFHQQVAFNLDLSQERLDTITNRHVSSDWLGSVVLEHRGELEQANPQLTPPVRVEGAGRVAVDVAESA